MTDTTAKKTETPAQARSWKRLWLKPRPPRLPRPDRKSRPVRPPRAQRPPERVEREWKYSETRDAGVGFFPFGGKPRRGRALHAVRSAIYWVRTVLALAFLVALLAVIVWAVGELRIHGYGPVDGLTAHAAHFARWLNSRLGGKKS